MNQRSSHYGRWKVSYNNRSSLCSFQIKVFSLVPLPSSGPHSTVSRCPPNEYQCGGTELCIHMTKLCNGVSDCTDGWDEGPHCRGIAVCATLPFGTVSADGWPIAQLCFPTAVKPTNTSAEVIATSPKTLSTEFQKILMWHFKIKLP